MKNQINIIAFGLIFLLSAFFIFLIHSEYQRNVIKREIKNLKTSNEILVNHLSYLSSVCLED